MVTSLKFISLIVDISNNIVHMYVGVVHRENLLKHMEVYGNKIEMFCNLPT